MPNILPREAPNCLCYWKLESWIKQERICHVGGQAWTRSSGQRTVCDSCTEGVWLFPVSTAALDPLYFSNFQLDSAAAWLEQRGDIAWRISGWGDMKLLHCCFQNGKGMKHQGMSKRNQFDPSFEDHSIFHYLMKADADEQQEWVGRCKALALSSTPEIHNIPVHPRFVAGKISCEASLDV